MENTDDTLRGKDGRPLLELEIAYVPQHSQETLRFTPELVFGNHCAIVGATGSGKSWTIATLVEESARHNSKIVLFDASGEFAGLNCGVRHVYLGEDPEPKPNHTQVVLPYTRLTERDLFSIFRPSDEVQAPKMRAAMRSLKLAKINSQLAVEGTITKANKSKRDYQEIYRENVDIVESPRADFDVKYLSRQIQLECVNPVRSPVEPNYWGADNISELGACFSLMTRIDDILASQNLAPIFKPRGKPSLLEELEKFFKDESARVLRISLQYLSFAHHVREIAANAVGRHIFNLARDGWFKKKPVVVILDEAHQFLNPALTDDDSTYALDSFALMAKESRKYSLNICIATQRPRDIPESILSQMGTMIVHRLTNDFDRRVVERASGALDESIINSLPTLAPGEAILVGMGFREPLRVKMLGPVAKPFSRGPDFQQYWDGGSRRIGKVTLHE
jgi:DNA helicase HerA-like ATPase